MCSVTLPLSSDLSETRGSLNNDQLYRALKASGMPINLNPSQQQITADVLTSNHDNPE